MRVLALTPGDPGGIGAEITWKALRRVPSAVRILCVGAKRPFQKVRARIIVADANDLRPPRESRPHVWLLEAPEGLPGFQAGWSIQTAARLVLSGRADALVTGPISKERLQAGGYPYSGHTDFLADVCGVPQVTMMLANRHLRVSLVTVHVALSQVPRKVTSDAVSRALDQTIAALRSNFGIKRPSVSVAALNPHGGEGGLFGDEDQRVVIPALSAARARWAGKAVISGPFPSDTLFAQHVALPVKKRPDAVICMYHDQGLIPVKLLDFPRTVNLTLGLPIIRTSVDHGTAFDIVGKNLADPSSMIAALNLAGDLSRRRRSPP